MVRTTEEAKDWGRRRWFDDDNIMLIKGRRLGMTSSASARCQCSLALIVCELLHKGSMERERGSAGARAV